MTVLRGVITLFIAGRGPPYRGYNSFSDIPLPIFASAKHQHRMGAKQFIPWLQQIEEPTNKCTKKRRNKQLSQFVVVVVVVVVVVAAINVVVGGCDCFLSGGSSWHHQLACFPPFEGLTSNNKRRHECSYLEDGLPELLFISHEVRPFGRGPTTGFLRGLMIPWSLAT